MNTESYPKKIFTIGDMNNCIITNAEENISFMKSRIDRLISAHNDITALNSEIEFIFTEFVNVYEFDKKTAVLPEPIGSFDTPDEKQNWIEKHLLAIEFDYHLGGILYNYHDWLIDNGWPDIILSRLVTDYPGIYQRAVYDYISVLKGIPPKYQFELVFHSGIEGAVKEREQIINTLQRHQLYGNNKAYFTSYALPTLVERFIISFTQQNLVNNMLKQIIDKAQKGELSISDSDLKFANEILYSQDYISGSQESAMKKCLAMFKSAGLVSDNETEKIVLGMNNKSPLTLGQFLKNNYAKQQIKPAYYNVMEMLFSTKKVNLRNSIMHGSSVMFDPYAVCFAAVMLQLFWAIIDRSIFQN